MRRVNDSSRTWSIYTSSVFSFLGWKPAGCEQLITVHLKGLSVECTCRTWLLRWSGLQEYKGHTTAVMSPHSLQFFFSITLCCDCVRTERKPWHSEDKCRVSPRRLGASAHDNSCGLSSWSAAGRWGRSRASRQSETGGGGWGGKRLWRLFHRPRTHGSSSPGWCLDLD